MPDQRSAMPRPSAWPRLEPLTPLQRVVRGLCRLGLVSSVGLLGLGLWCHFNLDAVIRLPFVIGCVVGGLSIGLSSLAQLARLRRNRR
jgi:hypothetical protein